MARAISFLDWSNFVNNTQISGFAEGDNVVEIEFLGKDSSSVGADGQMTVYLTANRSMKVTLHLEATSSGNAFLNKLWILQRGGPRTMMPIVYGAKDAYRKDIFAGLFGYISAHPKIGKGEKAGKLSWEFTFERGSINLGDPTFAGLLTAAAEVVPPSQV